MRKKLLLAALLSIFGFNSFIYSVNWTKTTRQFPGEGREYAVSFVIGSNAYVGLGYIYKSYSDIFYTDFYKYDSSTETWTQIANFPGEGRISAVAFSANGKGYVGLGYASGRKNDFYEYNPATNTWTQIANFPNAVSNATAFTIKNVGYVGTGYDGDTYRSDFYKYENGAWVAVASLPAGEERREAASYVTGGKGYIIGGSSENSMAIYSAWQYDPVANSWSRATNAPISSNVFISYVSSGVPYLILWDRIYRYKTIDDYSSWESLGSFFDMGDRFSRPVFFVINNVPYMTLGSGGSFFSPTLNTNLWYDADATRTNHIEKIVSADYSITQEDNHIVVCAPNNTHIYIADLQGKIICKSTVSLKKWIAADHFAKGIYVVHLENDKTVVDKKIVIK